LSFDPRVTPARGDLAAASLRGRVEAERFVEGERGRVGVEVADLKRQPRPDAPLETQLLYGETLTVYEDENGWGWVQADRDGYVGYVAMSALAPVGVAPTHRVVVNRTFVYPRADMKRPVLAALPLDGRVVVQDLESIEGEKSIEGTFLRIADYGFVYAEHLAPIDVVAEDYVAIAERLAGVPYLWGGKSPLGIDCSGLVSLALSLAGHAMPRDTDMQERRGDPLPIDAALAHLVRGDLVFWQGHVGIVCDRGMLLHANGRHMMVAREPLPEARRRILETTGLPISSCRRLRG
jgi:cell wall-associated NlpC family hydrolase